MKRLPNILTMSRIMLIPAVVACFFFLEFPTANWVAVIIYFIASITDFFDGYIARIYGSTSKLGQFLDPVADKLMVSSIILLLVAFDKITGIHVVAALIIMVREITVSGLREFLAEIKVSVPVTRLAKWKTTFQLFALGALILGAAAPSWLPAEDIGLVTLWLAAILTIVTGYDYLRVGLKHM